MSQRLRWARFLQMPEPEEPPEPDVEPKRSRGGVERGDFSVEWEFFNEFKGFWKGFWEGFS